jgi:uncharacterized protein YecT (DUF1311 family)
MKAAVLTFALFGVMVFSVIAAEKPDEGDPIDVELAKAIDANQSIAAKVRANDEANAKWHKRMDGAYEALKKQLGSDEREKLEKAQSAWFDFSNAQVRSIRAAYAQKEGAIWTPLSESAVMEFTKQRAVFLEGLLQAVSAGESTQNAPAETPFEIVKSAKRFCVGSVGERPGISKDEAAFREILKQPDAIEQCKKLLVEARFPGQMYGLLGLHLLDQAAFNEAFPKYAEARTAVSRQKGCILSFSGVSDIVKEIKNGKLK